MLILPLLESNTSQWVSLTTWVCLKFVSDFYLPNDVLHFYTEDETPPANLWPLVPLYISTDFEFDNFAETSVVMIVKDVSNKRLRGVYGRIVIVTQNLTRIGILWDSYKILNVLVIVPFKDYSNVYSWDDNAYPIRLKHIDTWRDNKFSLNANLFPQKLIQFYMNKTMTVLSNFSPYYSYPETLLGPEDKMIDSIALSLGYHVNRIFISKGIKFYNVLLQNGTVTGFVKHLHNRRADVAYGSILVTHTRSQFAEALPIYSEDYIAWSTAGPKQTKIMSGIVSGFSSTIWFLLLIVTVCFTLVFWAASHNKVSLSKCVLLCLRIVLASPYETYIQRDSAKIIVMAFNLFSLHMIWFYQCSLLSNLFNVRYETPILSLQEAFDKKFNIIVIDDQHHWLPKNDTEIWKSIFNSNQLSTMPNTFDRRKVVESRDIIKLGIKSVDEYYYKILYPDVPLATKVSFLHEPLIKLPVTMYMPVNHPMQSLMRRKTYQIIESGLFEYWSESEPKGFNIARVPFKKVKRALTMQTLSLAYYTLFISLLNCSLVFAFEVVYQFALKTFNRPKILLLRL